MPSSASRPAWSIRSSPTREKKAAYAADITYATNNELGFDYLRDNMKASKEEMRQRGHFFAIVDEVDSILIDEARTPLIISGPSQDRSDLYTKVDKLIPELLEEHYKLDEKTRNVTFTEEGNEFLEKRLLETGLPARGPVALRPREHDHRAPRQPGAPGAQALQPRPAVYRPRR